MPLLSQTHAMLAFAHAAGKIAPRLSIAVAALAAIRLWLERSWRAWALLGVTAVCAWLSRVNLFEFLFAPARGAQVVAASQFHDIRDSDMVIGVSIGPESRAYPVRYLAYHHMLNDQLGATAIVPTY